MARTDPRPNYGSKRRVRKDGYIDIYDPQHPLARNDGYVFEHRKMAWDAGILTNPCDQVHHIDEVKSNNNADNLQVKDSATHALDHVESRGFVKNQFGVFQVKPREHRVRALKEAKLNQLPKKCEGCDGHIPKSKRSDARYCSSTCQVRAWKYRHR